jgi:glycosyltransferase involved in cell wall biosynthesis
MTIASRPDNRRRVPAADHPASASQPGLRIAKRVTPPQPILFIHHANDMYGADIGLLHAIQCLDRQKYFPIVILPADMPTGRLSPELERLGVEYHFAPLGILRRKYLKPRSIASLGLDLIKGIAYVRATARERRVALVYTNTFVTVSGAIGGTFAGVPVLWHIREIVAMPRAVRWLLYKTLGWCADRVVCISEAVRENILKEAPSLASKAVVVYNAVTVAAPDIAGTTVGLREELGVPQDAPLVGMVGRISHWKGQEILAEAAALVAQNYSHAHFVAVGSYFADESHYLDKLKSLITTLKLDGRFHIADYRSNVTDVYRALDIFVLPSIKPEPFGRVTVEAMTQGRAVIATNHGGTVELIEDGVTGMLVPPADAQALAAAIEVLLADPALRARIGQAAAIYAQEHFGLPGHTEQMRQVVEELVTRP